MNTPTAEFIYGSQRAFESEDDLTAYLDTPGRDETVPRVQRRTSPYISVFEEIVVEINSFDAHLLSDNEKNALRAFSNLSYAARYVLIRLALRIPGWHPTKSSLRKYVSEIGEDGLATAAEDICNPVEQVLDEVKEEEEEEMKMEVKVELKVDMDIEVIDLTKDFDDENVKPFTSYTPPPTDHPLVSTNADSLNLSFFCQDQSHMNLDDALNRLSVDDLKALVKECKLKLKSSTAFQQKDFLISELRKYSRGQGDLRLWMQSPRKGSSSVTQEGRLQQMACDRLGSCLLVNQDFFLLLRRLDIIYYRSTSVPKSPFLNSYLSFFGKRTFPPYTPARSTIWETREDYLQYEQALDLQATIESLTDDSIVKSFKDRKTPRGTSVRFRTPITSIAEKRESVTPSRGRSLTAPQTPMSIVKMEIEEDQEKLCTMQELYKVVDLTDTLGDGFTLQEDEDSARKAAPDKLLQAARVVDIYLKVIRPMWESCIANAPISRMKAEGEQRHPGLERFEHGYILARLLGKVAAAYALLHKYHEELEVLQLLLDQRFWRRAKRGAWYDRRALVNAVHLERALNSKAKENQWAKDYLKTQKRPLWEVTRQGLYEALNDSDTHLVYRRSLAKRLSAIEKKLNVSLEEHHSFSEAGSVPNDVHFFADRADRSAHIPNTGKSVWKGLDGEPCNVETRALQFYEKQGFKGFHAETCILTTIFALLFFDIIFADIPGAFETKCQIAPLDLIEDSFYYAREEIIEARLVEIEEGKALTILEKCDAQHREQQTWCVGLSWDVCDRDELAEIVECMGPTALSVICKLFCLDYAARASGGPDLVLWNYERRKCKFVEVKGPGDTARENQVLWFDALVAAGLDVDLCRVVEKNTKNVNAEKEKKDRKEKREKKRQQQNLGTKKKKKTQGEEHESEGEDYMYGDDDAEYGALEDVDDDSPRNRTRGKRHRDDDDYGDDPSREVTSWPSDVSGNSCPRKRTKID